MDDNQESDYLAELLADEVPHGSVFPSQDLQFSDYMVPGDPGFNNGSGFDTSDEGSGSASQAATPSPHSTLSVQGDVCSSAEATRRAFLLNNVDNSEMAGPIGLRLSKTPSLVNMVQNLLPKEKQAEVAPAQVDGSSNRDNKRYNKMKNDTTEKLKASNFPMTTIQIGNWHMHSNREGDLTAKLYYAKRKLVWEVLHGPLKRKMEMPWSEISAIRATLHDDQPGILKIELNNPPSFHEETNPQPRKHTIWATCNDFTHGQALNCRIHQITFAPGVLETHYEKLLQCDKRLLDLSRRPFPRARPPFFDSAYASTSGRTSFNLNGYGSRFQAGFTQLYPTPYPTMARQETLQLTLDPTLSGINNGYRHNGAENYQYRTQMQLQLQQQQPTWDQGISNRIGNSHIQLPDYDSTPLPQVDVPASYPQNYHHELSLWNIDVGLHGDSNIPFIVQGNLQAGVGSMPASSLEQSIDLMNPFHNSAIHAASDYYQMADTSIHQVMPNLTNNLYID